MWMSGVFLCVVFFKMICTIRFGAQSLRKQQRHARIAATPPFIAPITVWIQQITLPMNYATGDYLLSELDFNICAGRCTWFPPEDSDGNGLNYRCTSVLIHTG